MSASSTQFTFLRPIPTASASSAWCWLRLGRNPYEKPRKSRSSSKVGVADRATPRPEPGAALALGTPDAIPSCERRDGRAGREGAAPLATAPCGVHPSVSCWKSEDGNGAAREDSDIDSGV